MAIASAAARAEVIDSSRQTGVRIWLASSACPQHVVLGERLLDQQQAELVEPGEVAGVAEGVGGVGVDLQQELLAEALADRPHRLEVPARLDLQLDAAVAGRRGRPRPGRAGRRRVGDPDRDAGGDARAHGAQVGAEGHARGAQLGVEHRHLERRLGHRVALDRGEERRQLGRRRRRTAPQRRARASAGSPRRRRRRTRRSTPARSSPRTRPSPRPRRSPPARAAARGAVARRRRSRRG